jgi:hypothetical protein
MTIKTPTAMIKLPMTSSRVGTSANSKKAIPAALTVTACVVMLTTVAGK